MTAPSVAPSSPTHTLDVQALTCMRNERVLCRELSFSVRAGEVLQVEGPNGCGKTTLLRSLAGLRLPAEGKVLWDGVDTLKDRAAFNASLSYLGHAIGVKGELSALENLRVAGMLGTHYADEVLEEALFEVGLGGHEDIPARNLSAGQQRRVALARLLLTDAPLWVLDEPFTAIDKQGVAAIERLLVRHADNGGLVILTSHHPIDLPDGRARSLLLDESPAPVREVHA